MRHTDKKPFDASIPICQISGQRFCYYRNKKEISPPYIGQLAMTFKKARPKMHDGQIA
jgi:hypothetical protein